jgi:hypothetical protein
VTDSERFYTSILDLFDDVEEAEEVNDLLTWWNRCAFTVVIFCSSELVLLPIVRSSQLIRQRGALFAKTVLWQR